MATQKKDQKHFKYEPQPEALDNFLVGGSLFLPYILIPLAIWRAVSTRHLNYRKGFTFKLISSQLIVSFVSYLLYGFFFNSIFAYIVGVFVISFVLLIIATGFYTNRNEHFFKLVDRYRQVIFTHQIHLIREIAKLVSQGELSVEKDLEYLMGNKHFPRGAIVNGKLMFERNVNITENLLFEHSTQVAGPPRLQESDLGKVPATIKTQSTSPQPKSVECSGCGSKFMLSHMESKECEYCGSLLMNR
ncbi:hypothetical protein SAMN04488688_10510 [Paenibacillus sp. cl141a]|uniref:hypothetical protein n=1 Tax=Paenibacillus sp. cl141a TaxID=1761877 RepID=UPI0008BBA59B|nr:hypothetical protein [Paenibacillus sp. cl141a]SEL64385.1 hypothetical protein SAMN04488688_10510 [Paenibacillus sp. cl141a]